MGIFNKIQLTKPKRSTFDMSYDHKLSLKMGKLIPVHLQETLPGDTYRISSEAMLRMSPMLAPIMHKVDVYIHHWFVPNRILWKHWEKFITGSPEIDAPPALPLIAFNGPGGGLSVAKSSLANYLGLPVATIDDQNLSALPFAAYQKIWKEYYRDQNLQDMGGFEFELQDGYQDPQMIAELTMLRDRAWEHDYFTSCLPFAQKGAQVDVPISLNDMDVELRPHPTSPQYFVDRVTGALLSNEEIHTDNNGQIIAAFGGEQGNIDPGSSLYVDGTGASTNTTINDLRSAFQLQKWLEKNARAGSRYVESLLAHWGVRSSDKRLQRPEYLGGSIASMAISEVLQTSQTEIDGTPQGNMSGHGISVSAGRDFKYYCEEHGYIMGIMSIRPKTAYYQGIPRHFNKTDKLDYAWPLFAEIGEQEVKSKEVFYDQLTNTNELTFGYIPRYSEYRYNPSRVSGDMVQSLEYWHMARKFDNVPTLNADFIKCNPTKRIFAVEDEEVDEIQAHVWHKILATRNLPKYGNPGSI